MGAVEEGDVVGMVLEGEVTGVAVTGGFEMEGN